MADNDNQPIEPDFAVHPGRLLAHLMKKRGMGLEEMTSKLGVFPDIVEDIIRGKCLIDSDLIPKLADLFGVSSSFWINATEIYKARKQKIAKPDPIAKIDSLYDLKEGWLEGDGVAFDRDGLDWLKKWFIERWPVSAPLPFLYPAAEGNVVLEWEVDNITEVNIIIVLSTHKGVGMKFRDMEGIISEGSNEEFELDFDGDEAVDELLRILSPED